MEGLFAALLVTAVVFDLASGTRRLARSEQLPLDRGRLIGAHHGVLTLVPSGRRLRIVPHRLDDCAEVYARFLRMDAVVSHAGSGAPLFRQLGLADLVDRHFTAERFREGAGVYGLYGADNPRSALPGNSSSYTTVPSVLLSLR